MSVIHIKRPAPGGDGPVLEERHLRIAGISDAVEVPGHGERGRAGEERRFGDVVHDMPAALDPEPRALEGHVQPPGAAAAAEDAERGGKRGGEVRIRHALCDPIRIARRQRSGGDPEYVLAHCPGERESLARHQYSAASMMVSTRRVTASLAGFSDPAVNVGS